MSSVPDRVHGIHGSGVKWGAPPAGAEGSPHFTPLPWIPWTLSRLLREHFSLVRRVISILGQRLRYTGMHLTNQNADVSHRLAFLLVTIAYNNLKERDDWEAPCPLPHTISQSQLATMMRSTQPTISAALQNFKNRGLIDAQGRRIVLCNPLALIKIIER